MTKIPSVEERFTANYLDGDKIQDGQMLSSRECLDAITAQRTALLTELREMIDRHDPNVKMERETNPAYWGNTLRAELDELINPTNA